MRCATSASLSSGALLTSLISAGVLATCQLQTLSKFGVFFALTILYAYLWSMFFLMPLLATLGPQPKGDMPSHGIPN